jgi:hypothetical protein
MFDTLTSTRTALETMAREFEPRTLTGGQAVRAVTELGAIRRLIDGVLGKAAQRVEETSAHRHNGESERDAAQFVGRAVGADASEARRVISTAKKVEKLPETDAAVRAGRLSARQAELIADAATANPAAERKLRADSGFGPQPTGWSRVTSDSLPKSAAASKRRSMPERNASSVLVAPLVPTNLTTRTQLMSSPTSSFQTYQARVRARQARR